MKMNEVQLIGRIAKNLELSFIDTQEGKRPVCNFILAVTKDRPDKQGNYGADFLSCVLWGKPAENLCKYQRKGKLIAVTGSLQTRNYDNKEGKKVYITEVAARKVQYLEKTDNQETNSFEKAPKEAPYMEDDVFDYSDGMMENARSLAGSYGQLQPEDII
ncbi:single-stranded DNA-binding protein [Listeria seeligeri]|uniref:single-stranded DNA-binding protein n=1 Tax=Listeria seeligeri TaxID=1640 RepID=UPI0022EC02B0|nr:single-stranded DNA-binding protein [Listeria seeligeri]